MGCSAGCRFAVERAHVEVKGHDTTEMGACASLGNMPDGRAQGLYYVPCQIKSDGISIEPNQSTIRGFPL